MINSQTTPRKLASLLGTTYANLTNTVYAVGVNNLYKSFTIPKKNGEERYISAPKNQLFHIQYRLKDILENIFKPHAGASAFIKGRGIVYNAKRHTKKEAVFNIDLEDFYDHIHFGRIAGLLSAKPYSLRKETANLIAHICCYNKRLPQGAPTSPIISNMICKGLDHRLSLLAKENQAHYSRYADDITFSFRSLSKNTIYSFIGHQIISSENLFRVITEYGFNINQKKTRLQLFNERQTVTGLKVNSKINLDRRYIRTTRAMLFSLSNGIASANEKYSKKFPNSKTSLELVVQGRISYIGMVKGVESSVYQTLARKFNSLPISFTLSTKAKSHSPDLIQKLQDSIHKMRDKLMLSVLVLNFDGIDCDNDLIEGTAFVLGNNRIITANHTFDKAGNTNECYLYKINSPNQKFKATIKNSCSASDVAELEIVGDDNPSLVPLKIGKSISSNAYGYKLAVAGFPQLHPGHQSVTIIPCTVTNTFTRSTFKMVQIDANIDAGNSGGPVLNVHGEVVGMAVLGKSVTLDEGQAHLGGNDAFISVEHLLSPT